MLKYFFLFLPLVSFSQVIKGSVKNDSNEALFGVSVVITKLSSKEIIAYDISDSEGNFSIKINSLIPKLRISVRILGYEEQFKLIDHKTKNINFILSPEITELKEVIVKVSKITRNKDTINYRVSSFANKKDRSISDVIAKMPGIEVLPSGKILYQGKPISKYYIEGLDLLEGKYSLANENLPFNQVSKVQILENHQPIKILDSLVFTDRAALNIKLKNNVSFTGQSDLGLGMNPVLQENNITPMLFSKQGQVIGSYQTNNTGNNIASQLETLIIEDLNDSGKNNTKEDWVSTQKISPPSLSSRKWLDNSTHVLSFNYLSRLKKDYNLRLNISFLNDYQRQRGDEKTLLFINNDTVKIYESTINKIFNNSLKSNFTIEKNTKKSFLKNSFKVQGFWDSEKAHVITNKNIISQKIKNHYFTVSNKLKNIFTLNKQLISFNFFASYSQNPQNLNVNPGKFNSLLNNGISYTNLKQKINLNRFYINNSLSFTKGIGKYTFTSNIGILIENKNLKSAINIDGINLSNNDFNNKLQWLEGRTFFNITTQYKSHGWQIELKTPLTFNYFNIEDKIKGKGEKLNKLVFEPKLSSTLDINSFWKIESSFGFKNNFGKINNVYYSYILNNYRNIKRINSPIPQSFIQNYSGGFSYRNQLKSLFGNIYYLFSNSTNNVLFDSQVYSNGNIEVNAILKNNNRESHTIFGKVSKYISIIKTSFTFNTKLSNNTYKQVLNNKFVDINNQNYNFKIKGNTDISDWMGIEYQGTFNRSKNKIQGKNYSSITNQNYLFSINFFPQENQFIGLNSEFLNNDLFSNRGNIFFIDLIYRYSLKTKKIDFELICNNIFNVKNHQTINLNNFSYIETNFKLRPSQIILKAKFSL